MDCDVLPEFTRLQYDELIDSNTATACVKGRDCYWCAMRLHGTCQDGGGGPGGENGNNILSL